MIGEVADVLAVPECHRERRCKVRLPLQPSRRLWATREVVLVVTDVRTCAYPIWPTLERFDDGEE